LEASTMIDAGGWSKFFDEGPKKAVPWSGLQVLAWLR
jgi:hypothetical protein